MLQYLVFVGAALSITGTFFYVRDTLRGDNKPNRVTWLMWSIAPLIGSVAAIINGVGLAALPVFMAGACPLLVFAASFVNPRAYWKLEFFDYACGFFALLALILWVITKDPITAIVFAIISDALVGLPTVIKSWKYPETESVVAYAMALTSLSTTFFAIKNWVFSEYAFAVYLVILNTSIVFALSRHKLAKFFRAR